jgi:hypothetical protein
MGGGVGGAYLLRVGVVGERGRGGWWWCSGAVLCFSLRFFFRTVIFAYFATNLRHEEDQNRGVSLCQRILEPALDMVI